MLTREPSEALRRAASLRSWLQTPQTDCEALSASLLCSSHLERSEVSACVTGQLSPFRDLVLSDGM